ncbi:MAG TPA: PKD domain-containing protein [Phnomibacter sp.]|nr:PKD domain-containing protein [Phnomibacter sp.]
MQNIFYSSRWRFLIVVAITAFFSCTKKETITITLQEPSAKFSIAVTDVFGGIQTAGTTTVIDSNFYFQNQSDSGGAITYSWNFGDGVTSTDKNPKHSYQKRGNYAVTLTVSNNNKVFDTLQKMVSVVLGQKHISLGDNSSIIPVAIEETSTNEFVLLADLGYSSGYHLYQLDSLLNPKSFKSFPGSYRLNSMTATNDGNYIFTGSTQANNKGNEIIKMRADGTQIWAKALSSDDSYSYAIQTPDGGFAVVGAITGSKNFTTIVKTDNNGNLQWKKTLNQEGMINSRNAIVEQDGIVVTGIKSGNCSQCDSICILKLDNAGNTTWKNTVFGGMNNYTWWDTRITKLTNGNYAVINGYTRGIFFFSTLGDFLDRKLAAYQTAGLANASDGNIIVLQTEFANGIRINITKLKPDGSQEWRVYPEGRQKTANGYKCCSSSWPINVQPLRQGGIIAIGHRSNDNSTGSGDNTAVVLLQLNEAGKLK